MIENISSIKAICSIISSTSGKPLTSYGIMYSGAFWEVSTLKKVLSCSNYSGPLWALLSAVNLNNKIGNFFRKTIDVRQGCIISPILFNLFRERIMQITLQDHVSTICISGRQICNLRLADDINLIGGSNAELQYLTSKLVDSAGAYGLEVSSVKSKIMVNSRKDIAANITMNRETLKQDDKFKYLGASLSKDSTCTAEVRIRIARATTSTGSPQKIWRSIISFKSKYKLYYSLVLSNLLYGCETCN